MQTITTSLTNKNTKIDNTICEAYECSRIATKMIVLEAGTKEITVYICDNCKSKFE